MEEQPVRLPDTIAEADEAFFHDYYRSSGDVVLQQMEYANREDRGSPFLLLVIYCSGMVDMQQLVEFVLPKLEHLGRTSMPSPDNIDEQMRSTALPMVRLREEKGQWLANMSRLLYSGSVIVYMRQAAAVYSMNIASIPVREPDESAMEPSIKGPRDGFTEDLQTNLALVRRRLCSQSLCIEMVVKGTRGQNRLALLYIKDILNPNILAEVRSQIESLDRDAIVGTSMIERMVMGNRLKTLFPLIDSTGRPDYVVNSLLNGRFAIMADGIPMATIAPITLTNVLKSPEDENMPFHIVSMQRLLRYIGLFIAIFLPGFYIGLTSFNLEQVPLPLLATIANTRQGLPMPVSLESLIMLGMFEIFAEAGRRLPRAIGQTVAVVGGIIIGDASIRAGITSPTVIVMISISIIASYTLVDPILNGTAAQVRLFILGLSSIAGLYGFMMAFLLLLVHLASLEHFGVPYLSPVTPFLKRDFLQGVFMKPSLQRDRRPEILNTTDDTSGRKENPT